MFKSQWSMSGCDFAALATVLDQISGHQGVGDGPVASSELAGRALRQGLLRYTERDG